VENEMADEIKGKLFLAMTLLVFLFVPIAVNAAPLTVSGHYHALAVGGCSQTRSEVLSGDFTGTGDYSIAGNIVSGTGSGVMIPDSDDTLGIPIWLWNGKGTGTISGNSITGSGQGSFSLEELSFDVAGPGQGTLNDNTIVGRFEISGADSLDGCPFTYSGYVDANPITLYPDTGLPLAAFVTFPLKGPAPLQVVFIDMSRGNEITSRVWRYKLNSDTTWTTFTPDGVPPNEFTPEGVSLFTFPNAGTYDIKLTVTGSGGSDDEIKTNYIIISGPPIAEFEATPTLGRAPLRVTFTDLSKDNGNNGITSRVWEYKLNSDYRWTTFSLDEASSFTFTNDGTYDVRLTLTGTGEPDDETKANYISVSSPPVAAFEVTPTSGPTPLIVTFTDKSTGVGITSRIWEYQFNSDGNWIRFTPDSTSSFIFWGSGSYDIKLTITGIGGSDEEIKLKYLNTGCDFSTRPNIERCFGGVGVNCEGTIGAPATPNPQTCMVVGTMSIGSILHDSCCIASNNKGVMCAQPDGSDQCKIEWDEAVANTFCSNVRGAPRQWSVSFGPYPFGNTGDFGDVPKASLKAPRGTRVNPIYQDLCITGKCKTDGTGNTIIKKDNCDEYCECQDFAISKPFTISVGCPVDLSITDPEGFTINKQNNEIFGATYTELGLGSDGTPDAKIVIPERKIGNYRINVIPKQNAVPTSTFTLQLLSDDGSQKTIASNIPINKITSNPYEVQVASDGDLVIINSQSIPTPEFPSIFLPTTMIIGFLGAVLLIQRTREH
jgi:PKD repeat protein